LEPTKGGGESKHNLSPRGAKRQAIIIGAREAREERNDEQ